MFNLSRRVTVLVIAVAVVAGPFALDTMPVSAQARPFLALRAPTTADVIDPFRLPVGPYGPGNRGLEYGTEPGDRIMAAAPGVVAFAGPVGGHLFVSIDHSDGFRTTYGFVDRIATRVGRRIDAGALVARAGGPFHFSLRLHGVYVDPAAYFGRWRVSVRLVPLRSSLNGRGATEPWIRRVWQIPHQAAVSEDSADTLLGGPFGPQMLPIR